MPYFNFGKKNIKLTVKDENDENNKEYFFELIVNLNYIKSQIENFNGFTISEVKSDIDLTERELEVLEYLAKGLNNPQIAKVMNITVHTVKVHIHNIYNKLQAKGRTQAVLKAAKANLLKL